MNGAAAVARSVGRVVAALAFGALVLPGAAAGGGAGPGAPATGSRPGDTGVIQVRVVSSATCTNTPPTIDLIRAVALELGVQVEVTRQIASTREEAVRHRFFGSPTVQVDGLDLEPARRRSTDYVLT